MSKLNENACLILWIKIVNNYQNKYYKNIEGNQAIIYRKKWKSISKQISSSTYRQNMRPAMHHLNKFMKIQ